jgi:hypothetical protein
MSGIAHELKKLKSFNLTPPLLSSSDLFIAFIVKVSGLENPCILTCEGSDHNIAFQDCTRVVSLEYVARDQLFLRFQLDLVFIFYALINYILLHHELLVDATKRFEIKHKVHYLHTRMSIVHSFLTISSPFKNKIYCADEGHSDIGAVRFSISLLRNHLTGNCVQELLSQQLIAPCNI